MADVKISELPALTSPDGAEELVVNDGGTTKKIAIEDLFAGDNVKAKFGASDDLQIYHDGANSYIKDVGTGHLYVGADNLKLVNAAVTEDYIQCVSNGAVTLYHNNSSKLSTTATGVDISGTVTSDGLVTTGSESSNQSRVTVAPNDNQNRTLLITEQKIEATAPSGYTNVQQGIDFAPASGYMKLNVGNAERMRIESSGNVFISTGNLRVRDLVTTTKQVDLTTSLQDLIQVGNRASYKITVSVGDGSLGGRHGYTVAFVSCSTDYARQGTIRQENGTTLILSWKAANGTSADAHTLQARNSDGSGNQCTIIVETMSRYASQGSGTGNGQSTILL